MNNVNQCRLHEKVVEPCLMDQMTNLFFCFSFNGISQLAAQRKRNGGDSNTLLQNCHSLFDQ